MIENDRRSFFIEAGPTGSSEGLFPAQSVGRRAMLVLACAMVFTQMDSVLTSLLIEPIKLDLCLSDRQLGLIQGLGFGLGQGVGAIPLGMLIDRKPRVWLLRFGMLAFVAAMITAGTAKGFAALFTAEITVGAVVALMGPAAGSLVSDFFPSSRRGPAAGLLATSQLTGQAGAYLVGGLLLEALARHAGGVFGIGSAWRMTYLAFAALSLTSLPVLMSLREPTRMERDDRRLSIRSSFRHVLEYWKFLVPLFAASTFGLITSSAVQAWIATILIRSYGLRAGSVGVWLGVVTLIGGILASLVAGWLARRARGASRSITSAAAIACLLCAPFAFLSLAPSATWVAACYFVIVATTIFTQVTSSIAIIMIIPNELRGLCAGIYCLLGLGVGRGFGPSLAVALGSLFSGPKALELGMGVVAAFASVIAAGLFLTTAKWEPLETHVGVGTRMGFSLRRL